MKRDEYLRRQEAKKQARAQQPFDLRGLASPNPEASGSELRDAAAAKLRHVIVLQTGLIRSLGYRSDKVTQ